MRKLLSLLLVMVMSTSSSFICKTASRHLKHSIIPEPQLVIVNGGNAFTINSNTVLLATGCEEVNSASFLKDYLSKYYGIDV
ncbi:MAG: hypothetical protein Q8R90_09770, partial [Bacteroidales bacterium]|nr:hypothetical protein [Bacteroidales bacterium]